MRRFHLLCTMLHIRTALEIDIPVIIDLAWQVWPHTYSGILSSSQISYMMDLFYSEPALQKQMADGHRFILAYEDEVPVGFASFNQVQPGLFKLQKIYVLPSQQGRGTGRLLVDHVLEEARKAGAVGLQLNVNRDNKARFFYEKLGFDIIREEDIDIGGGYLMNDYIMQKKLS